MLQNAARPFALITLAASLAVVACKSSESGERRPQADSLTRATATSGGVSASTEASSAAAASSPATASAGNVSESEVRVASIQFLQTWVRLQNARDQKLYRALYNPKEFEGLKRVHSGKLERFDFEGWMKDRAAMSRVAFEVAAVAPLVETWLDVNSTLRSGITRISFTQRWRSAKYSDHGPKALLLWRNPQTGVQQIVFEEMLDAIPGWESAPNADAAASSNTTSASASAATVTQVPLPTTHVKFDFSQGLGSVGLSMSNADAIARAALITPNLGAFARALLQFGSIECLSHVQYSQCGELAEDWTAVSQALVDHACVRRAALLPILQSGLLSASEFAAMRSELLKIPALVPVDELMVKSLAKTLERLPRSEVLDFAKVAADNREKDLVFERLYELLDAPAAVDLARNKQNASIVMHLDPARHAKELQSLHTNGTKIPLAPMRKAIAALRDTQQAALLEQLVDDEECALAMLAVDALAQLGRPQHLPTWDSVKTADDAWRSVCLLRHDPNTTRRNTELGKFRHASKAPLKLSLTTVISDNESASQDLTAAEAKQTPAEKLLIDQILGLFETGYGGFRSAEKSELAPAEMLQALIDMPMSDTEQVGRPYAVIGFFEEGAHVYLRHIALHYVEDRTCPC